MRVEKPGPYASGNKITTRTSRSTLTRVRSILLLNAARQSPTVVVATPPHEQHSATLWYTAHEAHTKKEH